MQAKGFLVLLAVTGAVVVAAAALSFGRSGPSVEAGAGRAVVPAVAQRAQDVGTVAVKRDKGTLTLVRGQAGWTVAERNNYPADPAKVRQALVGLAELKLVESKTRKPDLHPRLEVEDVKEGAKSALVEVKDMSGGKLAELIVGKRRVDRLGAGADAVYVRRPGEAQAWLAQGSLDLSGEAKDWLDKKVVSIPSAKVKQLAVKHPDGATVVLRRESEGAKVEVADAPADAKLKNESALAEPLGALDALELLDVAAAASNPVPEGTPTAELATFDGMTLTASSWEKDGTHWVMLAASGPGAEEVNARVKDWTFSLPAWKAKLFRTKLDELVEPPKSS